MPHQQKQDESAIPSAPPRRPLLGKIWSGFENIYHYGASYLNWRTRNLLGIANYAFTPERDFGQICEKGPQEVRIARSTDEVQAVLQEARKSGRAVNICAAHHSMGGQTLSRGGIRLVPQFPEETVFQETERGPLATLNGNAPWSQMLSLRAEGRAAPILTTHAQTTVAGTLSVSGEGRRSVRYGRQIDNVQELELILPSGEVVWCSSTQNPRLFRNALAGCGAFGVMRRVVMKTIDYRPYVHEKVFFYATFERMLEDLRTFAEIDPNELPEGLRSIWILRDTRHYRIHYGFESNDKNELHTDATAAFLGKHRGELESTQCFQTEEYDAMCRDGVDILVTGDWGLSKQPTHVPIWNDFIFESLDGAEIFLRTVEHKLKAKHLLKGYKGIYGLVLRNIEGRPRSPMSFYATQAPPGHYRFSFGYYYAFPRNDQEGIKQCLAMTEEMEELAYQHKGRLYLYAHQNWTQELCHARYREDWEECLALKKEIDPTLYFNADVLPFRTNS